MVVSSLASKYKTRVEVNGSGKHSSMATITALNSCIVQALVVGGYWAILCSYILPLDSSVSGATIWSVTQGVQLMNPS